jgi:hypothetical protein
MLVEIPDKDMVVEFPDEMDPLEVERVIYNQVYNLQTISQEPSWSNIPAPTPTQPEPVIPAPAPAALPGTGSPLFEAAKKAAMTMIPSTLPPTGIPLPFNTPGQASTPLATVNSDVPLPPNAQIPGVTATSPASDIMADVFGGRLPEGIGYLQEPVEKSLDILFNRTELFKMTAEEEERFRIQEPNLMAARYALTSLILPGISEKLLSPMERDEFVKSTPQQQQEYIFGLGISYAATPAVLKGAGKVAGVIAKKAITKWPWLDKPMGQALKESNWYRRATIRERGLAMKNIDETIKGMESSGMSEAEILRSLKKQGFEDAAYNRFAKSQKLKPEKPIVDPVTKPATPATKSPIQAEPPVEIPETGKIGYDPLTAPSGPPIRPEFHVPSKETIIATEDGIAATESQLKGFERPQQADSKISTLRGKIIQMGKIAMPQALKADLKEAGQATKWLTKKSGMPYDQAETELKADGWLREDEHLIDVLREGDLQRRPWAMKTGEGIPESKKTEIEKKFAKDSQWEPEAPPGKPGDYIQMEADELPVGKKLTILENESADGWDTYEVIEKDPFGVVLKDGREITIGPDVKVQVRKQDVKPALDPEASAPVLSQKQSAVESEIEVKGMSNYDEAGKLTVDIAVKKGPKDVFDRLILTGSKKAPNNDGGFDIEIHGHVIPPGEKVDVFKLAEYPAITIKTQAPKEGIGMYAADGVDHNLFIGLNRGIVNVSNKPTVKIPEPKTEPRKIDFVDPGQSGVFADAGEYAEIPAMVEMPELVQFYKEVSGGKYPEIKKKLRGMVRGTFSPANGKIKLSGPIFDDPAGALKTLAHEIGHWVDWLPDKTMQKGNILGRIASLKGYLQHWLDDILGGPGRITPADKKRLKAEAKAQMAGEKWIDEEITKKLPITPQDIIDIWNAMIDPSVLHPGLYDYIQRISTAEKKAIVKAAMKGLVPAELKQFSQTVTRKTGKKIKIKVKVGDKEVIDKFKELLAEEIKKRNIFNRDEIMAELKAFTVQWKPFDPEYDPKYTKYRFSGKELYADALSGILTSPNFFRTAAPKFWDSFFLWLHRKPEVQTVYRKIQKQIKSGTVEITKKRMADIYEMFDTGQAERAIAQREQAGNVVSAFDTVATFLWDKNHATLKHIRRLEKESGIIGKHAKTTRYMLEEINYLASEVSVYLHDFYSQVIGPLMINNHHSKELGLVMFQRRILGDRTKIGNPLGHNPQTVTVDMQNIEKEIWGPEKTKEIHRLAGVFRQLREDHIIPLIEVSGIANPKLLKIIQDEKNYVTFSNAAWFKNNYGKGPGAGFYRQIGTLNEVENPIISTILKDISLVRAARLNLVKQSLLVDLRYAGAIEPAIMRWSKDSQGRVPRDPTDATKALFSVLVNGKAEHFIVSKKIADTFKYAPVEATQAATIWRYMSQWLREFLVSKNPIWMARNVVKDYRTQVKNTPEIKLRHMPRLANYYIKAWPEVYNHIFKSEMSDDMRMLLSEKGIPTNRIWTGKEESYDDELDRIAAEFSIKTDLAKDAEGAKAIVKQFWNWLDKWGRMSDIWGKMAGYKYLKDHGTRSVRERAHVTRSRIGTPDYRRVGSGQQITNNLALFSNVGKEGIRATVESFKEDPGAYVWKTIMTNILPKIMLTVAGSSAALWAVKKFSDSEDQDENVRRVKQIRRIIEGVSEYDRANYNIIPLALTEKGKSVYLRIPEDYEGQFWGALAHKLTQGKIAGHDGILHLIQQQSPYKLHPVLVAGGRLLTYYIAGQNPVDSYRGRNIMPDMVYQAGGVDAHKAMAKSVWKELGGSLIYRPAWDGLQISETEIEKLLKVPPLNIMGTFVKISDQGVTEKIDAELRRIRKEKAKISLKTTAAIIRLANGDKLTTEDVLLIFQTPGHRLRKTLVKLYSRAYGSAWTRALTRPTSKEEKIAIINLMLEDLPQNVDLEK